MSCKSVTSEVAQWQFYTMFCPSTVITCERVAPEVAQSQFYTMFCRSRIAPEDAKVALRQNKSDSDVQKVTRGLREHMSEFSWNLARATKNEHGSNQKLDDGWPESAEEHATLA